MPCFKFKNGDNVGIVCTRGRRPKPCHYCGKFSSVLCDYPIRPKGKKKRTCDIPMCEVCTQKGISPDVDFCRAHYPLAKAAHERKQARNSGV